MVALLLMFVLVAGCSVPADRPLPADQNKTDSPRLEAIVSVEGYSGAIPKCQFFKELTPGQPQALVESQPALKLGLVGGNGSRYDVLLNDGRVVELAVSDFVRLELASGDAFILGITNVRGDSIFVCVGSDNALGPSLCEPMSGSERTACFDNLGYLNGVDFCRQMGDPQDRSACENGALGKNG